jgi:hypothetical protein
MLISQFFPKEDGNSMVLAQFVPDELFLRIRNVDARPTVPFELHKLREMLQGAHKPSTRDIEIVVSVVQAFDTDWKAVRYDTYIFAFRVGIKAPHTGWDVTTSWIYSVTCKEM